MKRTASTQPSPSINIKHTRANGEYLSRMYYNELTRTNGMFSIPDRILRHSKSIKPKNSRTPKSKKSKLKFVLFFFLIDITFCIAISEFGTYTEMRQKREEFRKKLITLIMTDDGGSDDDEFPNSNERKVLKYYHYIRHGIDTVHVAPMHKKIIFK